MKEYCFSVLFNWVTDFNLFGFKFLQSVKALVEDFTEGNHRYKGAHVFFTEGTVYQLVHRSIYQHKVNILG